MPGRLFLVRSSQDVAQAMGAANVPDLKPRRNISPGQDVLALTADGFEFMRWGMIPVGRKNARGRPVMETLINARSETLFDKSAFEGVRRCVVPADGWYEWTGEKRKKTAWQITAKSGDLLFFAAIYDSWIAPNGLELKQVVTVTCEPSADVRDIHHRMGVLLHRKGIDAWISGTVEAAKKLTLPFPDGSLVVSEAGDFDSSDA